MQSLFQGVPCPEARLGHPEGADPAARAHEPHQLGSGTFHSLAGDSSLFGPIGTNFRLIDLQVRRYFKILFVLVSRKDMVLGVLLREVPLLCGGTQFLTSLSEALY